jgi:tetrapyrrole methylase family protein/MazG family protein
VSEATPRIAVVGLGPGDASLLTVGAHEKLRAAPTVWTRTLRHPTLEQLDLGDRLRSLDHLYDTLPSVDEVYVAIARTLLDAARDHPEQEILYAVPGSPGTGEASVGILRELAHEEGVEIEILPGVSALEAAFVELGVDPLDAGMQTVDAPELAYLMDERPSVATQFLNATLPLLIGGVWQHGLASQVKLFLLALYPAEWSVRLTRAGLGERPVETPLEELDRGVAIDHLTTLYVPPLPLDEPGAHFYQLTHVVARLRGPGGCPWDREQTHASLKRYMLEEAYEAVEAIDADDPAALEEELGDVLLQVSLHGEIASTDSDFDIGDVVRGLSAKLVRRHPHVFGEVRADTASQVLANWQEIKRGERAERGQHDNSALDGIPAARTALARAQAVSSRAARTGFDWRDADEVWTKVREELEEVRTASADDRLEELGDLLFVLTNWARFNGLEAEEALHRATRKFEDRFREMERRVRRSGREIGGLSMDELDAIWDDVKRAQSNTNGTADARSTGERRAGNP